MMMPLTTNIPQVLFRRAFDAPRDPRSGAYKAGVLAMLVWRDRRAGLQPGTPERDGVRLIDPYTPGTAESDAWLSGTQEGQRLWVMHTSSALDEPAPKKRPRRLKPADKVAA